MVARVFYAVAMGFWVVARHVYIYSYIRFRFRFSHLADAFIQSDLQIYRCFRLMLWCCFALSEKIVSGPCEKKTAYAG